MERIRMMIIEGDSVNRRTLINYFEQQPEIHVVATAEDGAKAFELTKNVCPDAVLLDLVLPKNDGFFYLDCIRQLPGKKPNVIVASSAVNDALIMRAMKGGACFFMAKPLDYHSLSRRIMEFGWNDQSRTLDDVPVVEGCESRVSKKLTQAGMPANLQGFGFLVMAMDLIERDPHIIHKITKELYPGIAKNCNTHPKNVERSIRNAIDVAWNRGSLKDNGELFGLNAPLAEKPTNGEFMALLFSSVKYDF